MLALIEFEIPIRNTTKSCACIPQGIQRLKIEHILDAKQCKTNQPLHLSLVTEWYNEQQASTYTHQELHGGPSITQITAC